MAGRNGALPTARKAFRVVPETRMIPVDTGGEIVELVGYVRGPGCPMPVYLQVQEVAAERQDHLPTADEREKLSPHRLMVKYVRANMIERRGLLQAVIPGLTEDQANILSADDGGWHEILVDLGWWVDPTPDDQAEDAADPEATAPAAPSTGASDSPDSAPATQATIHAA